MNSMMWILPWKAAQLTPLHVLNPQQKPKSILYRNKKFRFVIYIYRLTLLHQQKAIVFGVKQLKVKVKITNLI